MLVQEYIDGKPFATTTEMGDADRQRIAEIVFRYAFGSIYRHHLFNGDPHPGNYLLLDDGSVAFVDYGCVSEFSAETIAGFVRILRAVMDDQHEEWRAAVEAAGILQTGAPFTTEELWDHMRWYWAPVLDDEVTFTPELAAEMVRRNTQTTGIGGRINKCCNVPEGTVFLTRINFGLAGLLGNLHARGPWRGIVREYIDGAPPCTELGRQSAATTRGPCCMTTQIALLRAINVGGRNMVSMSDLRSLFEAHGFDDVRSLLQTGNLVFRGGTKTGAALERLLESEAERRLHVSTTFIVRTSREWDATIESNPFPKEAVSDPGHLVVLFLKDAPNAPAVEALRSANKGPEIIDVVGKQLYVVYSEGIGRSKLTNKLIEDKLATRGTGRNWNTILKIAEMARHRELDRVTSRASSRTLPAAAPTAVAAPRA